jgi:hypothetical protein
MPGVRAGFISSIAGPARVSANVSSADMNAGQLIQGRYRVESIHCEEGGMGSILLVSDLNTGNGPLALKYCKEHTEEHIKRFRREARLMQEFSGNQRVVQLLDSALEHDPPYIVMPFYSDGDLRTLSTAIETDYSVQESTFLHMSDCINELHRRNTFHRDIKPQKFLRSGASVVVSDFGLSMELASRTLFTRSSQWWGTQGYIPPEFLEPGGFKNATPESDIFMLGKSFYALATGRDPTFINDTILQRPLAVVIDKCCQIDPRKRFHSIADLRQALVAAFNVLLKRTDARGEADFLLDEILEQLKTGDRYDPSKVSAFLQRFATLDIPAGWALISKFERALFVVLAQPAFREALLGFLRQYEEVVLSEPKGFEYAEVVAGDMELVFKRSDDTEARAKAFEIAVKMATRMNRFAAMDACVAMATSVHANDPVGPGIAAVILQNPEDFLKAIQPVNLKNNDIRGAVGSINKS